MPSELIHLQTLTHVALCGFADPLPLLSRLPGLQSLSISCDSSNVNVLGVPLCLGHLTGLTHLVLDRAICDQSCHRLSALRCLRKLCYQHRLQHDDDDQAGPDVSADGLFPVLGTLTGLQDITIGACNKNYLEFDVAVVSRLVALTTLNLRHIYLSSLTVSALCQQLRKLRRLKLDMNWLDALPSDLSCLTGLTALLVRNQSLLIQILEPLSFIQCMPELRRLDLRQYRDESEFGVHETTDYGNNIQDWNAQSRAFLADAESRILPAMPFPIEFFA